MSTNYQIDYRDEVKEDIKDFNSAQQRQIRKAIEKVSRNPLPQNEGGLGKPLGNKHGNNLTGHCKIVLKKSGIRVVYKLIRVDKIMKIVVVSVRSDNEVYDIAAKRDT